MEITYKCEVVNGMVRLEITEGLDETTYLDRMYLRVDDNQIIELDRISTTNKGAKNGICCRKSLLLAYIDVSRSTFYFLDIKICAQDNQCTH